MKTLSAAALLCFTSAFCHAQTLPGTKLWEDKSDPAAAMVQGIHKWLDREMAANLERRAGFWKPDFSSEAAYLASIAENRAALAKALGVAVDPPRSPGGAIIDRDPIVVVSGAYRILPMRWTVYEGFDAEGLLLEPEAGNAKACVIYLPDADQTPEETCGLAPNSAHDGGLLPPLELVKRGRRVLIPMLVSRDREFSGSPYVRPSKLTHREWIYRMAYEGGKHLLGYEVDLVRSALTRLQDASGGPLAVSVAGYGEGGLVALLAGALDRRAEQVWVRGVFGTGEDVWRQPIDRNVWGLLRRFGHAELAALIAPRPLVIEALEVPKVEGKVPGAGAPASPTSGRLDTPPTAQVQAEVERAGLYYKGLSKRDALKSFVSIDDSGKPSEAEFHKALDAFAGAGERATPGSSAIAPRRTLDPKARQKRMVDQLTELTQKHIRTSEIRRSDYWKKADLSSPEKYEASVEPYRARFWEEVIGKLPAPSEPALALTRKIYDEPGYQGFAVKIMVLPDVFASGVLLLPKDLKPGERRPVVVCQHGLEGKPDPVVDRSIKSPYNAFGAQLADRGYIVYAPQNPYIGEDRFRAIMRKANPLALNLFSFIVRQHEQTLAWLKTLENVDPQRIAFYGLSYGGKTAMRVPAILKDYRLSICSADFNEWVVKCTNVDRTYSYMYTIEYDMYEFGLSEGYNYAEMAALIAPRPFMVERGHDDGVAPDEWIGYEFAKIRRRYDLLGIPERAAITYFNGGHMIKGEETFRFLGKWLNWPR